MADEKKQSDTVVIKKYFGENMTSAEFIKEFKELTDEDKAELAEGIRNGTFTY